MRVGTALRGLGSQTPGWGLRGGAGGGCCMRTAMKGENAVQWGTGTEGPEQSGGR